MLYKNKAFENETLVLDGNEYIDCTFNNCRLTFAGTGNFEISPLHAEGIEVEFQGAAKAGADLQRSLLAVGIAGSGPGSHLNIGDAWFVRTEKPEGID